jgi:hypothetical protein
LRKAGARGLIDRPIWIKRKSGAPLAVRLVAVKKPVQAAAAARRKARRDAQRGGHQRSKRTLAAADWVILVTRSSRKTLRLPMFSPSIVCDGGLNSASSG